MIQEETEQRLRILDFEFCCFSGRFHVDKLGGMWHRNKGIIEFGKEPFH